MSSEQLIKEILKDPRLMYKPDYQEGQVNLLGEKIGAIDTELKNVLDNNKYKFTWLLEQVRNLKDKKILDKLDDRKKQEYKVIIDYYSNAIKEFIDTSLIENKFLETGRRPSQVEN